MSHTFSRFRFVVLLALLCSLWGRVPVHSSAALAPDGAASLPPDLRDGFASAIYGATLQGRLDFPGAPADFFGQSVALSADGNTALIGAPGTDLQEYQNIGVAYVFIRVDGSWQHQATLANYGLPELPAGEGIDAAAGGVTEGFGFSVSLSDDGNTALIGAPDAGSGIALVFTRSGTTWTKQETLIADVSAVDDEFGDAVALSGDGLSALIGAPGTDIGANANQGAAYLFTLGVSGWTQAEMFSIASGETGDQFGDAVSLDDNGLTAVIGAPGATVNGKENQGMAYVFAKPVDTWSGTRLTASDGEANDGFGGAVAVSGDGSTALIGAYGHLFSIVEPTAYVYTRHAGVLWGDEQKLTAAGSGRLGRSVALDDNGGTALLGATWETVGGQTRQGAAHLFTRSGATWSHEAQLLAKDGTAEDWLGVAAALDDSGSTAFVATVGVDIGSNEGQGAVYAFTFVDAAWEQVQKLTGASAPQASFGWFSALSADGSTAIVGAPHTDLEGILDQGAAYIFIRSAGVWQFQARLVASDGAAGDSFGRAVALSGDGNTAIVGAFKATVGGNIHQGAAYVFTRQDGVWNDAQKLTVSGAAEDWFGVAVALSGDANTALIGASCADGPAGDYQGATYVATRAGDTWTIQPASLPVSEPDANGFFGRALALNADGSMALVGAYGANSGRGAAYLFARTGSAWTEQKKFFDADGAVDDWFGLSVALSDDGSLALVGAHLNKAYAYTLTGTGWEPYRFAISGLLPDDYAGSAVALSGDGRVALIGAWGTDVSGKENQGKAYLFVRQGSDWLPRDVPQAADGSSGDVFGWSVAISQDGSTALVGAQGKTVNDILEQGAAYPYALDYPENYMLYLPILIR
ncbi:MAG: hypothetical protein ACOYYS_02930 [Chloroflexota bacterium]